MGRVSVQGIAVNNGAMARQLDGRLWDGHGGSEDDTRPKECGWPAGTNKETRKGSHHRSRE